MATAPSACSRRQTFTRRYPGFGGIWWIRRSHDSAFTSCTAETVAPACGFTCAHLLEMEGQEPPVETRPSSPPRPDVVSGRLDTVRYAPGGAGTRAIELGKGWRAPRAPVF